MYRVNFTKYFTDGNLKGLTFDDKVTFATLDAAADYVAFCHRHTEKPVKAYCSSNYTCHNARIEFIDAN